MPKRKRMSFTAKKKRSSCTPQKQSEPSGQRRPRGRPKAKPSLRAERKDASIADDEHEEEEPVDENNDDDDDIEETVTVDHNDEDEEMADSVTPPRRSTQAKDDEEEENNDPEEYDEDEIARSNKTPRLAAETVYVRKDTITKRWEHMDPASQRAVRQIFVDVARPVIASQLGEKVGRSAEDTGGRSAEAQQAVEMVVNSLSRQLHKMPMPPKTSSDAFDYEKMVRDTSAAEAQLSEHMAGIATLRAEIRRSEAERKTAEEDGLAFEKQVERHETELKKRLDGKFGRLLRKPDKEPEDSARLIRLQPRRKGNDPFASDAVVNDEVKRLMNQLSQHMASIQTNRAQTSSMEVELDHTKATVEHFLRKRGVSGDIEAG